jgi:hypothetical protein
MAKEWRNNGIGIERNGGAGMSINENVKIVNNVSIINGSSESEISSAAMKKMKIMPGYRK